MSLSDGGFPDRKSFWGIQLDNQAGAQENKVRVNSDTILHISKVLVDVGSSIRHQDNCSVTIGVRYEPDRCDCDVTKQSCSLHYKEQSCVICIIKPGQKCDADLDLDLHFVGGKNLTFYFLRHCVSAACIYHLVTVNISGYKVRG